MDLSGVIFVVLAVVWAVVLIPKALRHHDELARTRSVDEVSEDARVLARREAVDRRSTRLVVGPTPAPAQSPVVVEDVLAPAVPAAAQVPQQRRSVDRATLDLRRAAAVAAARRRRRILSGLLVLDVAVGVAAVLEVVPLWWAAVPVAMTLLYLVLCRALVRREHAGWDAAVLLAGTPVEEPVTAPSAGVPEPAPAAPAAVTIPAPVRTAEPAGSSVEEAVDSDAGSLWDPLPMTLPTYVGKARTIRSVRTIDLASPGVASSGRDAGDTALVAGAALGTGPGGDGTQQRAVGS